jgi:antitoxin (DNA-binding transcriptional repressor) of toxin-antitoxin stability system
MQTVSVHEAKTHLSRLLKKVQAGEDIVITSNGKPVATLGAPPKPKKRIIGDLAHLAKHYPLPEDFNDPMPEEWFDDPDDPLYRL